MAETHPDERYQTFDAESLAALAALVAGHRQATLATLDEGGWPHTAMTAYAPEAGFAGFLLNLSDLSPHKGHLAADPRASLLIAQPDDGAGEVMRLERLTLRCRAEALVSGSADAEAAGATYLARLPNHQLMFSLKDFGLVRLIPEGGTYVAGFGRAFPVTPADLAAAARLGPVAA
jgi:putative heme iron utilization protein